VLGFTPTLGQSGVATLQLTLQEQADDFMKEEITDADDYADWIRWVSDAEQRKQALPGAATCAKVPVLL